MTTMTDGNTDLSAKLSGTGGGSENVMAALFLDGITKFSGDDKTVSSTKWAQDLEDNAEIFQWSPQLRLIFARRSLIGTAALWLKGERAYKTYEELKAAVQKEFPESVNIKEMHEIMAARKKRRDESYYQYMLVMKELARRAKFPDYVGVQYVIDGIPDYESNKSLLYGATTYPALKEKLILYEKMKSKLHHTKHETISKSSGKIKDDETRRRQPSIRCYNCGDVTHVAKECVNGVKCFGCNKFNTGHLSSRCPDRINPAVAVTSSSVKQFAKVSTSSGGGGSAPVGRSVKPQSHFGNMADCHDDTYENDNTCQNCQNDSVRSMSVTNSSADVGVIQMQVQNKTKSGKPMKEVTVKQTTMKALIDSGSDVNLLSVEHCLAIGAGVSEDTLNLTGLGHTCVKSLGKILVNINVDSIEFSNVLFHVVNKDVMPFDMILGQEFLKNVTMIMNGDKVMFLPEWDGCMGKLSCFSDSVVEIDHNIPNEAVKQEVFPCIEGYNPVQVKEAPIQSKIALKDEIPVAQRPRRLSLVEQKLVEEPVRKWLDTGIVRVSISENSSPLVFVRKKDGTTRVCVDDRYDLEKIDGSTEGPIKTSNSADHMKRWACNGERL